MGRSSSTSIVPASVILGKRPRRCPSSRARACLDYGIFARCPIRWATASPYTMGCTERVSSRVLNQFRLQSYLLHSRKCLGHRAVALGGLGLLQEKLLIDPRDFSLRAQIDSPNDIPPPRAPEAHPCFGVDAFRRVALSR